MSGFSIIFSCLSKLPGQHGIQTVVNMSFRLMFFFFILFRNTEFKDCIS